MAFGFAISQAGFRIIMSQLKQYLCSNILKNIVTTSKGFRIVMTKFQEIKQGCAYVLSR
jgi:hypothetical protein